MKVLKNYNIVNSSIIVRSIIIVVSVFLIWYVFLFNSQNSQTYENSYYTKEQYHKDAGKIYFDLAQYAQKRKDYTRALKAYNITIKHCPNMLKAHKNIAIIKKLMQNNKKH